MRVWRPETSLPARSSLFLARGSIQIRHSFCSTESPRLLSISDPARSTQWRPRIWRRNSTTQISITLAGATVATFPSNVVERDARHFRCGQWNRTGRRYERRWDRKLGVKPCGPRSIIPLYATGQGQDTSAALLTISRIQRSAAVRRMSRAGFPRTDADGTRKYPGGFLVPGILPVVLSVGNASSQDGVTISVE